MKKRYFSAVIASGIATFLFAGISYAASINAVAKLDGAEGDFFDFTGVTLEVGSLKVGEQGIGGVTFFNGSIINNTHDTYGNDLPVTISDNLRVDGAIQRGHNQAGDTWGVKIDDGLRITGDTYVERDLNALGSSHVSGNFRVDGQIQRGHNLPSDQWGVEINDDLTVFGDVESQGNALISQNLTVNGSLDVQGGVGIKADTRKIVIPSAAFHVLRQSGTVQSYEASVGYITSESATGPLFVGAPLSLPIGARVVSATAYYEQIVSDTVTVQLRYYSIDGSSSGLVGQETSAGTGASSMMLNIIDSEAVISDDNQYYIYCGLPEYNIGESDSSKLYSVVIEYEITSL